VIVEGVVLTETASMVARAEELVRTGQLVEARDTLLEVTGRWDIDPGTFEEAILWMGRAGFEDEASRLVDLYVDRFHEEPEIGHATLHSIIQQRTETTERPKEGLPQVYRRLTMLRRGWPGRYLPFERACVKEIILDDREISVRRLWGNRAYRWSDIIGAELERQRSHTAVGYNRIEYVRRRLRLLAPDGEILLDVSDVLPEFEHADLIEQEIRRRVPVRTLEVQPVSKRAERRRSALVFALFVGPVLVTGWLVEQLL
jgi:hypothetical protein